MFSRDVHVYVYVTEDKVGRKSYRYRTIGKWQDKGDRQTIGEICALTRQCVWNLRELEKDSNFRVSLHPPSEIDWGAYQDQPLRCQPLSKIDADIFWLEFTLTEKEVAQLRAEREKSKASVT